MAADGSIVIETKIDNKEAQRELNSLAKKIDALQEKLNRKQGKQSALAEEARQIGIEFDNARKKLAEMQSGDKFYANSSIQEQANTVKMLEQEWNKTRMAADKLNMELYDGTQELNRMKEKAGELQKTLAVTGSSSGVMQKAMDRMEKSANKFSMRLREVVRSALVFTVISQGLASLREWMGKVIKTNSEATSAIARLKGALLTLAQPLLEVVIPAFVTLINILTQVISVIAQLISMLFGKTIDQSKEAAEGLYEETEALEGVGGAAEDAAGSLAGFDEINTIQTQKTSSGGAGASDEIAPDFEFGEGLEPGVLDRILELVKLIGSALLAWKISSALGLGLKGFLGLLLAIYSALTFVQNLFDAWVNGVSWDNLLGMILSATGLAAGLAIAFGSVAAGISLIVTGLAMLVTGFHDAFENGWNLQNLLLSIAGIFATGLGISLVTGSVIPALIAAIAAIVLSMTVATGHGEELLDGIKTTLQGFADFFTSIFTGDIDGAIDALKDIFGGLKTAVGAVIDGIRDTFLSFLDWLDEKTGGRLSVIIDFFKGLFTGLFDSINETLGNLIDSVEEIFGGIVNFIAGVFTQDWDRAWDGVKSIFTGIWNGIISALEGAVNLIIKGINWLISQLNKVSFTLPDWVPLIGGKSFGFNIPKISEVSIPRLAQGSVIPPNSEFLAVLGDNKQETEVVSPLSTMKQAMMEALQEAGGFGNGTIEVKLILDGKQIARNQIKHINQMTQQAGKPVLLI